MKKLYIYLIATILVVGCTDLDDTLYDQIPEDKYPENIAQVKAKPLTVYKALQPFLDNSGWWFAQEVPSDEMTCPTRKTDWDDGGKWRSLHQHTWDNNTEAVNNMWSHFYAGVVEANIIFDVTKANASDPEIRKVIAEISVLRALYYFYLIDNYGDVPYVTTFFDAPQFPEKHPRAAIFDSLVSELQASLPYVNTSNSKTLVTKALTYSLLAKLYLNAEVYTGTPHWEEAGAFCDSIIALGFYSLESDPLAPFVTQNESSTENIFVIPYDETNYTGFNLHMRTLHYTSQLTFDMPIKPWNGFAVMESHYNSYENADLRKAGYFLVGQQYSSTGTPLTDEGAGGANLVFNPHIPALKMDATFSDVEVRLSGARVKKFEIKTGAKANLSNDFPLFRYADILLMKAECEIRLGRSGDSWVNMIRTRAGVTSLSGVDLNALLAERGREMFWEAHRRQDLIRFGQFNKAWWEKDVSPLSRNTFPIPQWAIDANPNLAN